MHIPGSKRWLAGCAVMAALGSAGPASADIPIGLSGPMSGDNTTIGNQLLNGAEAAIEEINAHGGVLGEKLALTVEDDACDPKLAVPVANRIIGQKIDFLVGPFCSAVTLPASSLYADNGTVEITLSSNPRITEQGFDGLFRIAGRDDRQGKVLADFIARHHPGKRLALVADRSAYATGLSSQLRNFLKQGGEATIVLDQSIDAGTKNFGALVASFKEAAVDVIIYVGYPPEAGLIIDQAVDAGVTAQYIATNNMSNHRIWDIAGKKAEGLTFTFLPAADLLPTAQEAAARLVAKGKKADGYTLYSYAAVQLFAAAMTRAQSKRPDAVAEELQQGNIPTVLGSVSFDEKGDNLLPSWRVYRWHDGAYAYYPSE
ncbi:MAG: branched-chain amino acid ABC transporter substrate-binding protein [Aliidongia sp.]